MSNTSIAHYPLRTTQPSTTRRRGFTIVELLIIIAVITVLAAISIVAYNGVQSRAYDATRRSGLKQIATALEQRQIRLCRAPI
jgi:prepilin-type N-terminal cleavage/methylation domain-containing protein